MTAGLSRILETGVRAELSLFLMEIFISMMVSLSGIMMEVSLLYMLTCVEMGLGVTKRTRKMKTRKTWKMILQSVASMLI